MRSTDNHIIVVDAYKDLHAALPQLFDSTSEPKAELWLNYMSQYPELLQLQMTSYAEDSLDWRTIAENKVFPLLADNQSLIDNAYLNLKSVIGQITEACQEIPNFPEKVVFVIYVGIGCGAGWATKYDGKPAVLLGLEKIAECEWTPTDILGELIAHELGHIYHFQSRLALGIGHGIGPYWHLFSEGYAQRFQHWILGKETWQLSERINEKGWLDWCKTNKARLSAMYLDLAKAGIGTNSFFGDWLNIENKKQVGYYLGCEMMRTLEKTIGMKQIAEIEPVEDVTVAFLEETARET
jgi:hypothetical protein